MTRLALIADIHGNLPALHAIIDDMQQFAPDHVIVAGDLVNGAPFSCEVLEEVYQRRWSMIRGNHELYALHHQTEYALPHMRTSMTINWLHEQLGDWLPFIASMPDTLQLQFPDASRVRVVHGVPDDPFNAVTPFTAGDRIYDWYENVSENTVLFGHYHIGFRRQVGRWHFINPGPAVGGFDGDPRAHYAILDSHSAGWYVTFRRVEYDMRPIWQVFHDDNLFDEIGVVGYLMLERLRIARPVLSAYLHYCRSFNIEIEQPLPVVQRIIDDVNIWQYLPNSYYFNFHIPWHTELYPRTPHP